MSSLALYGHVTVQKQDAKQMLKTLAVNFKGIPAAALLKPVKV